MSRLFELKELIANLRVPQRVQSVNDLNRLLELIEPFATAKVRVREHGKGYWRVGTSVGTTEPSDASEFDLYDAWTVTQRLVGADGRLSFELVPTPAVPDHRPENLEAVDRAARRFAGLQGWNWDHLNDTHETPDGWSRNRCRDAVYQAVSLYRQEENKT